MVIDSSKFLAEKGKLPSRILLGRHKNWVHFIQLTLFLPRFMGACSALLSWVTSTKLIYYLNTRITATQRDVSGFLDGIIKKPLF